MYLSGLRDTAVPERKGKKATWLKDGRGTEVTTLHRGLKRRKKHHQWQVAMVPIAGGEKAGKLVREACVFERVRDRCTSELGGAFAEAGVCFAPVGNLGVLTVALHLPKLGLLAVSLRTRNAQVKSGGPIGRVAQSNATCTSGSWETVTYSRI